MKTYTKAEVVKLFHRGPISSQDAYALVERLHDHGQIEREPVSLDFVITERGRQFIAAMPQPEKRKRVSKPRPKKPKPFKPVHLEPHERKFSGLFYTAWNAIGFDVRDATKDELESMTPDVIAEVVLDCSYIETYCTSEKDKALIAELRALPYEEQKRLATGENLGF